MNSRLCDARCSLSRRRQAGSRRRKVYLTKCRSFTTFRVVMRLPLRSMRIALVSAHGLPLVGTFHTYGTSVLTHNLAVAIGARRRMQQLHVRIAVSEAAAWTARRFFGGRYRIIPNGVELHDPRLPAATAQTPL